MRSFVLTLMVCLLPLCALSQYEVLEAKKIKKIRGQKVKKGDFLLKSDTITIDVNGRLTLDVESAMDMKLAPGHYVVGAESDRHNEWYNTHLELTQTLKRKGMIMCKFTYKTLIVPGSDRHYEVDRIELDQKGLVYINSDTAALTIKWFNPDYAYKGGYHLIIRDFYNQGFIDVIEIAPGMDTFTFYPGTYGHRHMYYNILADDCRASFRYKIQVNSAGTYSFSETNFLDAEN